jgi:hypothetical protein
MSLDFCFILFGHSLPLCIPYPVIARRRLEERPDPTVRLSKSLPAIHRCSLLRESMSSSQDRPIGKFCLLASTMAPTSSSLTSGSRRVPRMAPIKPSPIFSEQRVLDRHLLEGLLQPSHLLAKLLLLLVLGLAAGTFVQLG